MIASPRKKACPSSLCGDGCCPDESRARPRKPTNATRRQGATGAQTTSGAWLPWWCSPPLLAAPRKNSDCGDGAASTMNDDVARKEEAAAKSAAAAVRTRIRRARHNHLTGAEEELFRMPVRTLPDSHAPDRRSSSDPDFCCSPFFGIGIPTTTVPAVAMGGGSCCGDRTCTCCAAVLLGG